MRRIRRVAAGVVEPITAYGDAVPGATSLAMTENAASSVSGVAAPVRPLTRRILTLAAVPGKPVVVADDARRRRARITVDHESRVAAGGKHGGGRGDRCAVDRDRQRRSRRNDRVAAHRGRNSAGRDGDGGGARRDHGVVRDRGGEPDPRGRVAARRVGALLREDAAIDQGAADGRRQDRRRHLLVRQDERGQVEAQVGRIAGAGDADPVRARRQRNEAARLHEEVAEAEGRRGQRGDVDGRVGDINVDRARVGRGVENAQRRGPDRGRRRVLVDDGGAHRAAALRRQRARSGRWLPTVGASVASAELVVASLICRSGLPAVAPA